MTDIPKELIDAVRSSSARHINIVLNDSFRAATNAGHTGAKEWLLADAIVAEREGRGASNEQQLKSYEYDKLEHWLRMETPTEKCRNNEGMMDMAIRLIRDGRPTEEMVSTMGGVIPRWKFNHMRREAVGCPFSRDLLEVAWGIIANANEGDWSKATDEWREAAERWRDEYHGGPPQQGDAPGENEDTAGARPTGPTAVMEAEHMMHVVDERCKQLSESRAASIERVLREINSRGYFSVGLTTNADGTEKKVSGNREHIGTFTAEPLDAEWKWTPATTPDVATICVCAEHSGLPNVKCPNCHEASTPTPQQGNRDECGSCLSQRDRICVAGCVCTNRSEYMKIPNTWPQPKKQSMEEGIVELKQRLGPTAQRVIVERIDSAESIITTMQQAVDQLNARLGQHARRIAASEDMTERLDQRSSIDKEQSKVYQKVIWGQIQEMSEHLGEASQERARTKTLAKELTKRLDAADEERQALASLTRNMKAPGSMSPNEKVTIGGMRQPKEPPNETT